jgi:hypothetical protein
MNRRSFFSSLAGFAAALQLDPEKALWHAGQKKIFIPQTIHLKPGLAFNHDAFALPGISMRFVREFDVKNARFISRMDALYGFGVVR